ncbi:sialate O-acetylesterase [uncultured Ilyobacter sp.]|uniref:sialate O-acetylesterase n=1 Tax=uncultured Ilyobacter sp. TaxID=544433 RepID=UPI0029C812DB|nr:sialate O-acetylesterase [uncultured Ilyobacter sp.]
MITKVGRGIKQMIFNLLHGESTRPPFIQTTASAFGDIREDKNTGKYYKCISQAGSVAVANPTSDFELFSQKVTSDKLENLSEGTEELGFKLKKLTESSATDVVGLVADFNTLINALITGGSFVMPDDELVFLLTGQSNMAGRDVPIFSVMPNNVKAWGWSANDWVEMDTLNTNNWRHPYTPNPAETEQDSLGIYFAQTVANAFPKNKIRIIHVAQGGQSIDRWYNKAELWTIGDAKIKEVIQNLYTNKIAGILWHQGEADYQMDGATYLNKLLSVISDYRGEAYCDNDTPFITGELLDYRGEMNTQLETFSYDYLLKNSFIECDQSEKLEDNLHFNHDGLVTMGTRYADKYVAIVTAREKLVNDWHLTSDTDLIDYKSGNNFSWVGTDYESPSDEYVKQTASNDETYLKLTTSKTLDFDDNISISFGASYDGTMAEILFGQNQAENFLSFGASNSTSIKLTVDSVTREVQFSEIASEIPSYDKTQINHYVFTQNATTLYLYVNKTLVKTWPKLSGSFSFSKILSANYSSLTFKSKLKYLRFFNDYLSVSEIEALS